MFIFIRCLVVFALIGCSKSVNSPVESTKEVPSENVASDKPEPSSTSETPPAPSEQSGLSDDKFNIDLIFVPGHRLTTSQIELFKKAARLWESIIVEGIEDMDYSEVPWDSDKDHDWGKARGSRIVIDGKVDDLLILVTTHPVLEGEYGGGALGGVIQWRASNGLPILSEIVVWESTLTEENETNGVLERVILHEIAHTLGFGTTWGGKPLKTGTEVYFPGPLSIIAFDELGGKNYKGNKVPVSNDEGHWHMSVFGNELMAANVDLDYPAPLSLITIQALADIGYKVDVSKAEGYLLLPIASTKPVNTKVWCRFSFGRVTPLSR